MTQQIRRNRPVSPQYKTKRKFYSAAEKQYIADNYKGTLKSAEEIAKHLNRTFTGIRSWTSRNGYSVPRELKIKWTPERNDALREACELYTAEQIHELPEFSNFTINAIHIQIHLLGLSAHTRSGWYTVNDIADLFNVSQAWVSIRVNEGKIKYRRHSENGRVWHIDEHDLREFILNYPAELSNKRLDFPLLLDIILNGKKNKSAKIGLVVESVQNDKIL